METTTIDLVRADYEVIEAILAREFNDLHEALDQHDDPVSSPLYERWLSAGRALDAFTDFGRR